MPFSDAYRILTARLKERKASCACYSLAASDGVVRGLVLAGEPRDGIMDVIQLARDGAIVACGDRAYRGGFMGVAHSQYLVPYQTRVIVLRNQSSEFLWSDTDADLYHALCIRYSTPLLPDWTPYLRHRLEAASRLRKMDGFNHNASYLDLKQDDLDQFVAEGLRTKRITIPTE